MSKASKLLEKFNKVNEDDGDVNTVLFRLGEVEEMAKRLQRSLRNPSFDSPEIVSNTFEYMETCFNVVKEYFDSKAQQ